MPSLSVGTEFPSWSLSVHSSNWVLNQVITIENITLPLSTAGTGEKSDASVNKQEAPQSLGK